MANCHSLFLEFEDEITINKSRVSSLRTSRDSLRDKIRSYFKDHKSDEKCPKFTGQGSFMTDTLINPIPRQEVQNGKEVNLLEYDIDDGVYFICDGDNCERRSIPTYHRWIVEATDSHTENDPIDKDTCVRIIFSDGHNIDLPIYYSESNNYELAHKSKGWLESDPKEFTQWVKNAYKNDYQIRRLIKYLKAWKDFRENSNRNLDLTSGLVLTILVVRNYTNNNRDDIAFYDTVSAIKSNLITSFTCYRPTKPRNEDLLNDYNHKETFLRELDSILEFGKEALDETDQLKACKQWQNVFGDKFSCSNTESETDNLTGLKTVAASSKPWKD